MNVPVRYPGRKRRRLGKHFIAVTFCRAPTRTSTVSRF